MTSIERHEARYQRRKAKRNQKRIERAYSIGTLSEIFTYHDLFADGRKCCNGVRWKQSTQNFEAHLFSRTAVRCREIKSGTYKPKPCNHFTLTERGKTRPIDAPHINDRQVQKTLTRKVLYPLYSPSMIYDNGASIKGKGLHFSYERLKMHLRRNYRKCGTSGYVVLIDLHGFFPNAPQDEVIARHEHLLVQPDLCEFANTALNLHPGGIGMPLGEEPSQVEMVSLPSAIDNYIKCQLHESDSGHYMDDYYIFVETKERAQYVLKAVTVKFAEHGMQVNPAKSYIQPLTKPFRFCKCKFQLTDTGRIITHGCADGMKRARRKLKLFARQNMPIEEVKQWMQTARAYYNCYNDHGRILRLERLFYALFIAPGGATCSTS